MTCSATLCSCIFCSIVNLFIYSYFFIATVGGSAGVYDLTVFYLLVHCMGTPSNDHSYKLHAMNNKPSESKQKDFVIGTKQMEQKTWIKLCNLVTGKVKYQQGLQMGKVPTTGDWRNKGRTDRQRCFILTTEKCGFWVTIFNSKKLFCFESRENQDPCWSLKADVLEYWSCRVSSQRWEWDG